MTFTNKYVFNTKTKTFMPWADWILEACEDSEINMKQPALSPWIADEIGGAK